MFSSRNCKEKSLLCKYMSLTFHANVFWWMGQPLASATNSAPKQLPKPSFCLSSRPETEQLGTRPLLYHSQHFQNMEILLVFRLFSSAWCQPSDIGATWDYWEKHQWGSWPTRQTVGRLTATANGHSDSLTYIQKQRWEPAFLRCLVFPPLVATPGKHLVKALRQAGNIG